MRLSTSIIVCLCLVGPGVRAQAPCGGLRCQPNQRCVAVAGGFRCVAAGAAREIDVCTPPCQVGQSCLGGECRTVQNPPGTPGIGDGLPISFAPGPFDIDQTDLQRIQQFFLGGPNDGLRAVCWAVAINGGVKSPRDSAIACAPLGQTCGLAFPCHLAANICMGVLGARVWTDCDHDPDANSAPLGDAYHGPEIRRAACLATRNTPCSSFPASTMGTAHDACNITFWGLHKRNECPQPPSDPNTAQGRTLGRTVALTPGVNGPARACSDRVGNCGVDSGCMQRANVCKGAAGARAWARCEDDPDHGGILGDAFHGPEIRLGACYAEKCQPCTSITLSGAPGILARQTCIAVQDTTKCGRL